ncbi:MAG TPA: hypothetical protein VFC51_05290 [Chloroflexota bacterium]|nr:hypothetical protein [Chloroflexota bacterium]
MRLAIGVMGSSEGPFVDGAWERLQELGRTIAERDCVLLTGACPGLSYAAVQGAKEVGGLVVGISPGLSLHEHVHKYGSPVDGFDVLIYTGSGLMGREIENIRSSDIVVIAGGRSGTLGEFSIAYDEGRLIGVLTGTGGVADAVSDLVALCNKETGAVVLYDAEPRRLIERLLAHYEAEHRVKPSSFWPPVATTR